MSEIVVTSNQPKTATTPAKASETVVEAKETVPAAADKAAETIEASGTTNEKETRTEEGKEGEALATEAKIKAKSGYKKRIDKLNTRLSESERENAFLRGKLDAKANPDGTKQETKVEAATLANGEPDPEKFGTPMEYYKALSRFEAKTQFAEERKAEISRVEERHTVERAKTSILDAQKKYKDWNDVVTDDVKVTPDLQRVLLESDDPGQLMYELCKNPEEYEKIVALKGSQLTRAIGRFEAKLEPKAATTQATSEERPVSKAPAPITPVGNKGTGAGKKRIDDPNLTQKEYEAMRREQMKAKASSW